MNVDLDDLQGKFEACADKWNSVYGQLKSLNFDVDKNIPAFEKTLSEFNNRIVSVLDFIGSKELMDDNSIHLLSELAYKNVNDHLNQLSEQMDGLSNNLKTVKSNGGLKNFDTNNFHAQCDNGQNVDLKGNFTQIQKTVENIILQSVNLYGFSNTTHTADLTERNRKLQELINSCQKQIDEFETASNTLDKKLKTADKLQKNHESTVQAAEKLRSDIDSIQKEATNHHAELKSKVSSINEIATQAEALKKRVDDYHANFEAFDKQLEGRKQSLEKAQKETEQFLKANKDRESQIEQLTQKADTLIKGATVVGLANSFSESADEFKEERDSAKKAFYWSIFVLFICTLPLAVYIFSNLSFTELPKLELTGIITRAVLLLPGIWLTRFNSRRYYGYSELHRQYSHKATVAKAIEGFKKESPEYKEQISAAAFMELHTQPEVDYGKNKKLEQPLKNPPLRDLMSQIGQKIFQGKQSD